MPAFVEFALVAMLLYLWESTLWLPLRGVTLRRKWFRNSWKILSPDSFVATREVGLIAMLPFLPDRELAPCQSPPLLVTADGGLLIETTSGLIKRLNSISWDELKEEPHHLVAGNCRTRISSPRGISLLRRARKRGATPEQGIRQAMRLAMSPARAGREWKRWRLVSTPLHFNSAFLTVGFFIALPLVYLRLGGIHTIFLAAWLWFLMVWTACHLWWLGSRVYPDARKAFLSDALLALLVPFHAMRAPEIASVHAMATTHPVGLILATCDVTNPWLKAFVRRTRYPMLGRTEDAAFQSALRPFLESALSASGLQATLLDTAPDPSTDTEAKSYCPRCHGFFLAGVKTCADCHGIPLLAFTNR